MKTYNNSVVLRNDGVDPSTLNTDLNAALGINITVRAASTPIAGLGALASIFDIADVAIANPMQTDDKGNYTFKVTDGIYDIVIAEGTANEKILASEEIFEYSTGASINNLSLPHVFDTVEDMTTSTIVFPTSKPLQVFDEVSGLYSNYVVTSTLTALPLTAGLYAFSLESSFDPSLTTAQAINNNTFNNSSPRGNKLQVFAHRGMAFQFPENTMVACSASINLGVDGLELDAAVSSDGVTYLFHDETVDALTDGTGTFTALTSTYLDTLKFTSTVGTILANEKIPRLIDVLTLARRYGTYVMLELKLITSNADIDLIISDIVASGMEHLVSLQSGNLTNVQYVRGVNSVINVGYITADPAFSTYIDPLVLLGNATVTAQHDMIFANQGIVKYARDRGVDLVAYTVNDNIFAKRIQKTGVNKIMSDRLTGEILR